MFEKNKSEYCSDLDKWTEGLLDEMIFWEDFMNNEGGAYDVSVFENYLIKDKRFVLEKYLPNNPEKRFDFIDVGSGPFSTCGFITDKVILNFVAIDPLGEFYNNIKRKYACENGIIIQTGFIELLDKLYESNSFDMVHIRNALDHCFDPMFGIYQLLRICRIGGTVVMRHFENEAEHENYIGLHKWNLSLVKNGSYKIWNRENTYDLKQEIGEYADVLTNKEPIVSDSGDLEYEVVLTKKKDISIPQNTYYEDFLWTVYSRLLTTYMKIIDDNKLITKIDNNRRDFKKLEIRVKRRLETYVAIYSRIIIYGLGKLGQYVLDECRIMPFEVIAILDKEVKEYKGQKSQKPQEFLEKYDGEPIFIAVSNIGRVIKEELVGYGFPEDKIVWIAE